MLKKSIAEGFFLNLVRGMINNEPSPAIPKGITADELFEIGFKQDMTAIVYCALNGINPRPKCNDWTERRKHFLDECMRSEVQISEYNRVIRHLCGNGVKVIPLKGCVIKDLYPTPNLRAMSDLDLLYEGVPSKELARLMKELGYSTENLEAGCHDVFCKRPSMRIELHRELVPEDSPYRDILENMFERAVPDEAIANLFHLTNEDLYLHTLVHAAKHFKGSGLGIRPVCDIYMLERKLGEAWNRTYIEKQLEIVNLTKFERKMLETAHLFFDDENGEIPEELIDIFFCDGTYGKYKEAEKWSAIANGNNNLKYVLWRIFMPLADLKKVYPVLKTSPFLYPFLSVYRWIDRFFHSFRNVKQILTLGQVSKNEEQEILKIMKEYGLNE